jgi:hypothetical protein
MLGSALDKTTALVGRAFVIAAYFPILLFSLAIIIFLVAAHGYEEVAKIWENYKTNRDVFLIGFVLMTIAAAYLLMIVNPVIKRVVEGSYDLNWIAKKLRRSQISKFEKHLHDVSNAREIYHEISKNAHDEVQGLQGLYRQKITGGEDDEGLSGFNEEDLTSVENTILELKNRSSSPEQMVLIPLTRKMEMILQSDCPIEKIDPLQSALVGLWERCRKAATNEYSQKVIDFHSRYPVEAGVAGVRPTTLGNIFAAIWEYSFVRYGIDAAFFWPRLQKIIPQDYLKVVQDARISYDFTVAMMFLFFMLAVFGLVYSLTMGSTWDDIFWPVGSIFVVICVFAVVVFRLVAVEAARSLGMLVQSCFDLFRFKLLDDLEFSRPETHEEEKELWAKISQFMIFGGILSVNYKLGDHYPGSKSE